MLMFHSDILNQTKLFSDVFQEMSRKIGVTPVAKQPSSDSSNLPDDFIQNTKLTTMKLGQHVFKITLLPTVHKLWDVMTSKNLY